MISYEMLTKYILEYESQSKDKHEVLERAAVGYIHLKMENIYRTYVVDDRMEYAVEVNVENFNLSKCECKTYKRVGKCNHIISVLFYKYDEQQQQTEKQNMINYSIEKKLIGLVENKFVEYQVINIRPKIYINNIDNIINIEVVASIEGKREYIIKDPVDFLKKVYNTEYFKSNKAFELFENMYVLNKSSQALVDILNDNIFQNEKKFYIKSSEMEISPIELKEIINIYNEDDIIEINYTEYYKKLLPISELIMQAAVNENLMQFNLIEKVDIKYLASDDILLFGSNVYTLNSMEKKIIKIFKPLLVGEVQEINITDNYFDFFVLNIKDLLSEVFTMEYHSDFDQEIVYEPLECEINISMDKKSFKITPYFIYADGKFTIDNQKKHTKRIIVDRDIAQEKEILSMFENKVFRKIKTTDKKDAHLETSDVQVIYDVFKLIIPQLKERENIIIKSEFEYDDIFKKINIDDYRITLKEEKQSGVFDFDFEIKYLEEDEIDDLMRAINDFDGFYVTAQKRIIQINDELEERIRFVNYILENMKNTDDKIPLYHLFFLKNESERLFKNVNISKILQEYLERKNEYKNIKVKNKHATLRDYQKSGVRWMQQLNDFSFGGILADDMGLGKTIQAITFLNYNRNGQVLIVAPKSLLYNWYEEIKKFGDGFKCSIVEGSSKQRKELIANDSEIKITSYQSVRNDLEYYEDKYFEYLILDEAQFIKNPKAKVTQSIFKIKAKTKFALTGTPVENNLVDLWSIFSSVMPGFLLTQKSFEKKYLSDEKNVEILKRHIKPFMLRRLKKDVLNELPDKIETPIYCDMNLTQKKLYQEYASKYQKRLDYSIKDKDNYNKISILADIIRLRQIAIYPSLFIDDYNAGSLKFDAVIETINENVENNNKIVVFSQFTKMLKIAKNKLEGDFKTLYIDGQTDSKERLKIVDEFNTSDAQIILVSLKAGGVGLNLTGANTVIHIDPWWNPAVENQATDRVHRIGQKDVVQVYKFITVGTIEEKIYLLKQKKENLLNDVVSTDLKLFSDMSDSEIHDLFEYKLD